MSTFLRSFKLENARVGARLISERIPNCQQAVSVKCDMEQSRIEWNNAKPYSEIPGPKPLPIPAIGNFWRFLKFGTFGNMHPYQVYQALRERYGDVVRLSGIGREDVILLYNPSDFEKMFRNESIWPVREALESYLYYQESISWSRRGGKKSLVVAQGEEWYNFRSTVNPFMMQPRRAKLYAEPMNEIAAEFIGRMKKIRDEKSELPEDFSNELNKLSLESIAFIALDTRLGCLADDLAPDSMPQKMINATCDLMECFSYLEIQPSLWKYVSTPMWRKFARTVDFLSEFTSSVVNEKVKELESGGEKKESMSVLESLLRSKNPNFALVMSMDMLIAGIDTTSTAVASILSLLSMHHGKQERLYQELKSILPGKDTPITGEKLSEMKYLKACIRESLRLRPVAMGHTRTMVRDIVLGGYRIPKGSKAFTSHSVVSVDEKYFRRAEEFIPERWLKSEGSEWNVENVNPFLVLPFGFGPRMCAGRRFAELEAEIIVAKIIRNFKMSYNYGEMEWSSSLFIHTSKPLKFEIVDREN